MGTVEQEKDRDEKETLLTHHDIKVFLIDDQAIVAAAVKQMLAPEKDIILHYCQDPGQAVQKALEVGPTVILQDLVMPGIDGLTLVKYFRVHPQLKDVPLIVLSSKEEAVTKAEAFALGANDYLVKLPDRIELVARIRYHSKGYINLLQRNEAYDALVKSQEALAAELNRAAEYVVSLIPAPVGQGSVTTDWRFIPSAQLGGDCFGYHWVDPDHFAMYLLDVCGHGVGSALLSVSALNVIRSQTLPGVDFHIPEQVLCGLNSAFQMANNNQLYFTLWYGVYSRKDGVLRFCSAGHPPALLMQGSGSVESLSLQNMPIGFFQGINYSGGNAQVELPATLYVYSDGVYEVESPDGIMWSWQELQEFLTAHRGGPENEIDALQRFLQKMSGNPAFEDDFSMLKINFSS